MPYILDGHNLIPKIPGLSLRDPDDETRLLEMLQGFARRERARVEVFFDRAPDTRQGKQTYGRVTAHFVTHRATADEAIQRYLQSLGKGARNWTVVSSDRQVQVNARALGARVLPSETFAIQITQHPRGAEKDKPEGALSADEVDEWLRLFGEER